MCGFLRTICCISYSTSNHRAGSRGFSAAVRQFEPLNRPPFSIIYYSLHIYTKKFFLLAYLEPLKYPKLSFNYLSYLRGSCVGQECQEACQIVSSRVNAVQAFLLTTCIFCCLSAIQTSLGTWHTRSVLLGWKMG